MKKDFSQEFELTKLHVNIIVKDEISKKYLLLGSVVEYEEGFFSTLSLAISPADQITKCLTEYLHKNNLALSRYRELAREVNTSFSFVDDTPGSETIHICILAEVNSMNFDKFSDNDTKPLMVDLYELLEKLSASPYSNTTTELGIAQLIYEDKVLNS